MPRQEENPAAKYNARTPQQRDRERPTGHHNDPHIESHDMRDESMANYEPDNRQEHRNVRETRDDFRAGAGGSPDKGPGDAGGTLGTGGSAREQDR